MLCISSFQVSIILPGVKSLDDPVAENQLKKGAGRGGLFGLKVSSLISKIFFEVKMQDREAIYDEEIAPLMDRIIEVCKRDGIPFFCDFQLTEIVDDGDERSGLFCTTSVFEYGWEESEKFRKYLSIGRPKKEFSAFMFTTHTSDGDD